MGRWTIRKSGVPLTQVERNKRCENRKKARAKAEAKAARQARRIQVQQELGILPLAIADITDAHLRPASVDAIITDPPYAERDLPLYGDLARLAIRVLKPSGWCLAMAGDLYLDRIIASMVSVALEWRGLITVIFPGGAHSRIASTATFQAAKTVIMLQKPPIAAPPEWGPNLRVIAAPLNGYDKSLHPWQQSQYAFEKMIERFSRPGDLVVDPFAGSGTTLRAALSLGRRAWGSDIDAGHGCTAFRAEIDA